MKLKLIAIITASVLLLTACNSGAQNNNAKAPVVSTTIEVIQFHNEHRCYSCLEIEKLTKATLAKFFPSFPFKLLNVEDKKNEKIAEEFEATGTALFLYNPKTGKKKNLTEFAFLKVGNAGKFEAELKKFIEDFIKS
jgi:hypothetical protein